jgi:hypothetical protein
MNRLSQIIETNEAGWEKLVRSPEQVCRCRLHREMSANDPKRSTNSLLQTKGWAAPVRLSSRKNHSNGGKAVQAQHRSIRYGEHNGLKTGERNRVSNRATSYGDTGCPKAPSRCNRTTNAFWRSDNRASDFRVELRLSVVEEPPQARNIFLCQLLSVRHELEAIRYE